jgi:uncharacterized membrane protein
VDWLLIAVRILHIGAAVGWVGGAALFSFFVEPTLNAIGPDAEKVTGELIQRRKLPRYFAILSTTTVLAGAVLYWIDSGGLQLSWITSPTGLAFTISALAAIAAWLGGGALLSPAVKNVAAVGTELRAAGGPPSAELMARMHAAQERVRQIGLFDLGLLIIAVIGMAVARYLR